MVELLWYLTALVALIIIGGFPFAAILRRRNDPDFWIHVLFFGLSAWAVGLNLVFELTRNFQIAAYGLLLVFAVGGVWCAWRCRPSRASTKQARIALAIGAAAALLSLLPAGIIGLDAYIGVFGGDSNQYARGADMLRRYAADAPFHPLGGYHGMEQTVREWRPGPFMLIAMGAELVTREPFQAMSVLSGLSNALAALGGYVFARRHLGRGPAIWCAVIAVAVNSSLLYNALHYYSGKALGLPLVLMALVAFVEFASRPLKWRRIGALALLLGGVVQIYFEAGILIAPAAGALFVIAILRKHALRFIMGGALVIALCAAATPNLFRMYEFGVRGSAADLGNPTGDFYWQRMRMPDFLLFPLGMLDVTPIRASLDDLQVVTEAPAQQLVSDAVTAVATAAPGIYLEPAWDEIGVGLRTAFLLLAIGLGAAAIYGHVAWWRKLRPPQRTHLVAGILVPLVALFPAGFLIGHKGRYNLFQYLSIDAVYFLATGAALAALAAGARQVRTLVRWGLAAWAIIAALCLGNIYDRVFRNEALVQYYKVSQDIADIADYLDRTADSRVVVLVRDDRGGLFAEAYSPPNYMLHYRLRRHPTLFYRPEVHFPYTAVETAPTVIGDAPRFCSIVAIEAGDPSPGEIYRAGKLAIVSVDLDRDDLPQRDTLRSLMDPRCAG